MAHKFSVPELIAGEISAYERFEQMAKDPSIPNVSEDRLPGAVLKLHTALRGYRAMEERGELDAAAIAAVNELEDYINNLTAEISDDMEQKTEELELKAANDNHRDSDERAA